MFDRSLRRLSFFAATATLFAGAPALAQAWLAPTPGDWFDPANWAGSVVPNSVGASASIGDVASGGSLTSGGNFNLTQPVTLGSLAINRATAGPGLFFQGSPLIFDNGGGSDVFLDASGILALEIGSDIELRGQLVSGWTASNGRITGVVSGGFGITHNPPFEAILELRGTNTYTGETRVLNGRLRITTPDALGSDAAGTFIVGPTSSLIYDATGPAELESLTLENGGRLWLRPATITSDIVIDGSGGMTTWFDNSTAAIAGVVSGDQFVKSSAQSNVTSDPTAESILFLSNPANTYTGGTIVRSGVLAVFGDGSLGGAGTGITFDTVGFSDGPPALATRFDATIDRPIAMSDDAGLRAHENTVAVYPQAIMGIGRRLTINAPAGTAAMSSGFPDWTGTVVLQGDNEYTGGTTVRMGTLVVASLFGSSTGPGPVLVEETATIAGGGIIQGPIDMTAGGSIEPGAPVGSIITGPITMGPLSTTVIELTSPSSGLFDKIITGGPTTVDGELVVISSPLVPFTKGDMFEIVSAGSLTGTFADVSGGDEFDVQYNADSVTLVFVGAPECPADLDGDSMVGASDLAVLLAAWGQSGVVADFDGGGVSASDLATLIAAWGACE